MTTTFNVAVKLGYTPLTVAEDDPRPTAQTHFLESASPYPGFYGGRGIGKTLTSCAKGAGLALSCDADGLVVAPSWGQIISTLLPIYEELLPWEACTRTDRGIYHATDKCIRIEKGLGARTAIWFRSAEESHLIRTMNVGWCQLEEVESMPEAVFRDVVRFAVRREPRMVFVAFTPPEDDEHWAWKRWADPSRRNRKTYPSWTMQTKDNWKLDPDQVRRWYEEETDEETGELTATGLRELSGIVAGGRPRVFPMFSADVHVRPVPASFQPTGPVAAGIDYGRISAPTTVVVTACDPQGRVWWVHEFGDRTGSLAPLMEECLMLQRRYPGLQFYADWGEPGTTDALRRHGVHVKMADKDIDSGIRLIWDRLARRVDGLPGMYVASHLYSTIHEFQTWRCKTGTTLGGHLAYDSFEKGPNDYLDAGRYAMKGLLEGKGVGVPFRVAWGPKPQRALAHTGSAGGGGST